MDHNYLLHREIKQNDTILILGAYDGDFMREKRQEIIDKNAFIINIEPDYRKYISCLMYAHDFLPGNAIALNIAIFDKSGIVDFDNKQYHQLSAIDGVEGIKCDTDYMTKVATISLDVFLTLYPDVNCIFCDIEGAELEVFLNSVLAKNIEYIAIASYHIRDEKPTYEKLQPYFTNSILEIDDSTWDNAVLYYKRG